MSLKVGGQFAVLQLVAVEALMASGISVLDDGERKAEEAVHVHHVGG